MTDLNPAPNPLGALETQMATAAARHIITAGAGALVAHGVVQASQQAQAEQIALGVVVWAAGYALSWVQKRFVRRTVAQVAAADAHVVQP